jgi:hypothetical protein
METVRVVVEFVVLATLLVLIIRPPRRHPRIK